MNPAPKCPSCHGNRTSYALVKGMYVDAPCPSCNGLGVVSETRLERMEAGGALRQLRIDQGYSLRRAAELIGVSPTRLSLAEQGECRFSDIEIFRKDLAKLEPRRPAIG